MTDLEMTKLCAEAMAFEFMSAEGTGLIVISDEPPEWAKPIAVGGKTAIPYDPLHDDAQAMALVKRFALHPETPMNNDGLWTVEAYQWRGTTLHVVSCSENADLNRAIVECVAKMQQEARTSRTALGRA